MQYELKISNYKTFIFLGYYEWEQQKKRPVILDIHILFKEPPSGCFNDQLQDTVCYSCLIQKIEQTIGDKRFKLIEHVAQIIFSTIKSVVQDSCTIFVEVSKTAPIKNLGKASFKISEG